MAAKTCTIEVDEATAEVLEARAAARGMSISELLADLAGAREALPAALQALRDAGDGPWAPNILAEDARRLAEFRRTRAAVPWDDVKAWMETWGTPNELPAPKPRRL
jgi:predicted transcriptional regulator